MLSADGSLWKYGLIPQAIANGLASILVLFFLISDLHGGLLDVGLVAGVSALALIPSQVLWGRLVDNASRCKPFLVAGFLGMGASFAAVPWAGTVAALLALVAMKSVLYAATLPARQLLTVESEQREGWSRGLANMQFLTGMGETAGMGIGALYSSSASFAQLFLLCAALCVASAALLAVVAREPGFMIQRRLVAMERSTSTLITVSDFVASPARLSAGVSGDFLRQLNRSTTYLMVGVLSFSLAGSALFSPLPAYFLRFYSSDTVFLVFFVGSLVGALCYLVVGRLSQSPGRSLLTASLARTAAMPFLVLAAMGAGTGFAAAVLLLSVLEAFWSLFDVSSMFAFLENSRVGRAGFYGAAVGLGAAGGGVLGGWISSQFGFTALFGICSAVSGFALVAFALQFRGGPS